MNEQIFNLANAMSSQDAGSMGGATGGEYDALLGQYRQAKAGYADAQGAGKLGGTLLATGLAVHPALALAGGLMAWRAKQAMDETKGQRTEAFEKLSAHEDFDPMRVIMDQEEKRGLGERFKGIAGSLL